MSATVFFADPANEVATLTNVFKVGGISTDPGAVTLTVTDPAGATTTPAVTHVTTGTYSAAVACTVAGVWLYKWAGTGAAADVTEGTFTVTTIDNSLYCTVEELKSRLQIGDVLDDFEAILAVQAACRAVDNYCQRYFYRITATRTYVPHALYETKVDDLVSVTTLATDPSGTTPQGGTFPITWATGAFQLLPYNPGNPQEPWPYTSIRAVGPLTFPWIAPLALMRMDRVQVTGVFGWPAVPLAVKQAALITAADLFRLKDAPFGVAGFGEFGAVKITANPRVAQLLSPYCRAPFLAA